MATEASHLRHAALLLWQTPQHLIQKLLLELLAGLEDPLCVRILLLRTQAVVIHETTAVQRLV